MTTSLIPRFGIFTASLLLTFPAAAADRVALVIGNNGYQHARKLATAVQDATSMAAVLKDKLGFKVILRTEAKFNDMVDAVDEFKTEAAGASAVFIYFAGHGMESAAQGGNFLIPVDALLEKESHLKSQAYALDTLLADLAPLRAPVRLVVLDCCRNNPLEGRSWSAARGDTGLARLDLQKLDAATMVVFSAGPGKVAKDRVLPSDTHSPFATALLANIQQPGTSAFGVFSNVEGAVFKATGEVQKPKTFFSGELAPFQSFVFLPGGPGGQPLPPATPSGPDAATRDRPWVNRLGMEFIPLPGHKGTFMCRTETRVRDFRAYAADTGYTQSGGIVVMKVTGTEAAGYNLEYQLDRKASWEKPGFSQSEDHPVVGVSWHEAQAFVSWLSKKDGITYRLPTDAEWSAAVGVGKYPWGNTWPPPEGAGNYAGSEFTASLAGKGWRPAYAVDDGASRTATVASFKENRHGFHDLGGNVGEWCEDVYRSAMNTTEILKANPELNEETASDGTPFRVSRGGSWIDDLSAYQLSSCRFAVFPKFRLGFNGFRVVVVGRFGG
jgi:formylglycine-generating enzyme required for sulfatase activity